MAFIFACFTLFFLISTSASPVQTLWYETLMLMVRDTDGVAPPTAARVFAYVAATNFEIAFGGRGFMYERIAPTMPIDAVNTEAAMNYAFAHTLTDFFVRGCVNKTITAAPPKRTHGMETGICPSHAQRHSNEQLIMNVSSHIRDTLNLSATDDDNALIVGNLYANSMLEFARTDGGHYMVNFDYRGPSYPGSWIPTTDFVVGGTVIDNQHDGLLHRWGSIRPFISPECIAESQPKEPPKFSNISMSLFHNRASSVYIETVENTPEQLTIAEFWSDDPGTTATPPGHSISIATQLSQRFTLGVKEEAFLFAMVGAAINDAFISCWKTKYDTNYMRPISYINQNIDISWKPHLITPPFPEYTSGHSVQTAAAVEVLKTLFGDIPFNDSTHVHRHDINGETRTFSSLSEMGREAANSRIYGGIHFKEAVELGLYQGEHIGKCVVNAFRLGLDFEEHTTCAGTKAQYQASGCCESAENTMLSMLSQFALRSASAL